MLFPFQDILKLVLLLSSLQLTAEGKPLGCSQISQIEIYYPTNPGAENKCVPCPECPEGQGLTPQCGSKRPNDTRIECIQCQANVSYSNIHGIESCKACHDCGLKNIIQHCTPEKNRKCGTKCPQRHFLDDNNICQECYFCCDSVSDAQRHQVCINIGMTRNWQCKKTEENQRCYEDWKKVTTTPKKDKEQEHGAVSFRVVIGVVTTIFFISALALVGLMMTSKLVKQFCQFSRPNQRNLQEGENKYGKPIVAIFDK